MDTIGFLAATVHSLSHYALHQADDVTGIIQVEVLDYITVVLSGVAALTGVIGVVFLRKQTENLRLPSFRGLSSDERDILKAMRDTGTYVVSSFNTGELMPFIVHQAEIDEHGFVSPAGLVVSRHYYEPCLRLKDRGIARKPESNINKNVEYELTPKGVRFLKKLGEKLDNHNNHGRFRDRVEIERERRIKPNTLHGTAHDCIGGEALGSDPGTLRIAMVIEYPLIGRTNDRICDVILPKSVKHVQVGDYIYLRFNQVPLFLDNRDWFQVVVTKVKENDDHKIFVCGNDIAWSADASFQSTGQSET